MGYDLESPVLDGGLVPRVLVLRGGGTGQEALGPWCEPRAGGVCAGLLE